MEQCDAIWPVTAQSLQRAAARLRAGDLVVVPTETVYGLAASADNGPAVARIFATKGRPTFNPLIVHVATMTQAEEIAPLSDIARRLAEAFWPGPLTLVVKKAPETSVAELATAGLETVALRMPAHPVARQLLEELGTAFVAPSANRSGRVSPTRARHVVEEFSSDIPILDGGPCADGIESTIVDVSTSVPRLLRPGPISAATIEAVIGSPLATPSTDSVIAPGMLASHYAPAASVRLNARRRETGEALLGFGNIADATLNLSPSGDLIEAAANLFDFLRQLDASHKHIAVSPIPDQGLGAAINDRLQRAAAPRP